MTYIICIKLWIPIEVIWRKNYASFVSGDIFEANITNP